MLSTRVNGNIFDTMVTVTPGITDGKRSLAANFNAANVRGPAMPSASRPALF